MLKQFLQTGEIVGTHGIRGEMRVKPWCDSTEFLSKFKKFYLDAEGKTELKVEKCRPHGTVAILKVKGVDSIEQAEHLRNTVIYINRKDAKIEKGSYFVEDLLGCKVIDIEDESVFYGEIDDCFKTGANDVWSVKKGDKTYLLPVVKEFVISVDVDNGIIKVKPIKGIFDDED